MRKETIQSQGTPNDWPSISPLNWKWLDDVYLLLTGRQGRQNFINTLTDAPKNNFGVKQFFISTPTGNAEFLGGDNVPYIGTGNELIVPTTITASRRNILNTASWRIVQNASQTIPNTTASVVTFNLTEFDQDNAADVGTGTVTPIQAGLYWVHGAVGFAAASVAFPCYVSAFVGKNGLFKGTSIAHTSSAQDIVVEVGAYMELDGESDYVQLGVQHNFGVATDTYGNEFTCFFEGFKVS